MGFLKTIETVQGLTVNNAYHRVETIQGNKTNLECSIGIYASKQAADDGKAMISSVTLAFEPSSDDVTTNVFKQVYAALFATNDYADVTHILEDGQQPL